LSRQKEGDPNRNFSICWDYHVFLIVKSHIRPSDGPQSVTLLDRNERHCFVYDLDSNMQFPCHFGEYVENTFSSTKAHSPVFRVIPGDLFIKNFGSDRSHMKDKSGLWLASPPPYPPIQPTDLSNCSETSNRSCVMNLRSYRNMTEDSDPAFGTLMPYAKFFEYFAQ